MWIHGALEIGYNRGGFATHKLINAVNNTNAVHHRGSCVSDTPFWPLYMQRCSLSLFLNAALIKAFVVHTNLCSFTFHPCR